MFKLAIDPGSTPSDFFNMPAPWVSRTRITCFHHGFDSLNPEEPLFETTKAGQPILLLVLQR